MILYGLFIMILLCFMAYMIKKAKSDQLEKIGYKYY